MERSENARKLADAGVPIAFGNVSGFDNYLDGVRKHIAAGLSREAALRGMTLGAATIFGVEKDLGSVAPGKWANFTIMDGDFASDKSAVVAVYVHGVRYETKKEASK